MTNHASGRGGDSTATPWPVAEAALDEHAADATHQVRGSRVARLLAVLDERDPVALAGERLG